MRRHRYLRPRREAKGKTVFSSDSKLIPKHPGMNLTSAVAVDQNPDLFSRPDRINRRRRHHRHRHRLRRRHPRYRRRRSRSDCPNYPLRNGGRRTSSPWSRCRRRHNCRCRLRSCHPMTGDCAGCSAAASSAGSKSARYRRAIPNTAIAFVIVSLRRKRRMGT